MNIGKIALQRELREQNLLILFLQLRCDIDSDKSDVNINKTYIILLPATRLKSCETVQTSIWCDNPIQLIFWCRIDDQQPIIEIDGGQVFLTCICITIGLFTNRDWLNQYRD